MRALAPLAVIFALGCANGGDAPPETPSTHTSTDASTDARVEAAETSSPTDASPEAIFPTDDTGVDAPTPCRMPVGTTATASASYMSTPDLAFDGDLGSYWNSGDHSGWIRLKFPAPTRIDRVRIAGHGLPPCDETYTLSGFNGGSETSLGSATRSVSGTIAWLDEIPVAAGSYDELLISVAPADSWIAISELLVYDSTSGCTL